MQRKGILITGGAGYIGSHVVRQLGGVGRTLVVLDNLSTGFRSAVTHGTLVVGDTGDAALVAAVLRGIRRGHDHAFRGTHGRTRVRVGPAQVLR